jgi:hypothetical protein
MDKRESLEQAENTPAVALEMYLLRKQIEKFNDETTESCEIEASDLARRREELLYRFYATAYGANVLPLLSELAEPGPAV